MTDLMEDYEEAKRMLAILNSLDIKLSIDGCGCCGSPLVTFKYKGETIVDNIDCFNFDNDQELKND